MSKWTGMIEKRPAVRTANRPDIRPRDEGVLFHNTGATGWGRRRDIRNHKGHRTEADFSHLHDKFTEEEA
jgi:hypothetical protein